MGEGTTLKTRSNRRTLPCAAELLFALLCLLLTATAAASPPAGGPAAKAAAAEPASPLRTRSQKKPFPLVESLYILVLAGFLGFEVIGRRVAPAAHAADVGHQRHFRHLAGRLAGDRRQRQSTPTPLSRVLGFVAVTAAMINVVGGFMITDRCCRCSRRRRRGR